ncbi:MULTISPECIES: DUF6691 family protein [unclassified Moraxella]|uniref:DUF6691 family protein n=1 Tax=unclassified Moraxella TaxID=2685852 RepID=UPI003AF80D5A
MQQIIALVTGLIFGIGLIIGDMVNPAKVQGFLDIFGKWDMSLAFVMGGGLLVASISFALAKSCSRSLLGDAMSLPTATQIDKRLLIGSSLFGIGWGITGICPAPAMVLASTGAWQGVVFVVSMILGMGVFKLTLEKY